MYSMIGKVSKGTIDRFLKKSWDGGVAVSLYENPREEIIDAIQRRKQVTLYQRTLQSSFSQRVQRAAMQSALRDVKKAGAGESRVEDNYLYSTQCFVGTSVAGSRLLAAGSFLWFQNSIGGPASNDGFPTTFGNETTLETNMIVPSQIAQGQAYVFNQQGLSLNAACTTADVGTILDAGSIIFSKQGNQWNINHGPARMWPGGTGIAGYAATAVGGAPLTIQSAHNGAADPRAVRTLKMPRMLKSKESFSFTYFVPRIAAASAAPGTFIITAGQHALLTWFLWGQQFDHIPA
jgi:hypothetical protein